MNDYKASNIKILKGLDPVKKRPGMYIGSTDERGLHHLIWEILDNSIDEIVAGDCDEIKITINLDSSVIIEDNGRGIPIDIHPETNKYTIETILTTLHAGGKFDNEAYKVSGGLHGVGASVVNALSEYLEIEVCRNKKKYYQKFIDGGKVLIPIIKEIDDSKTGTKVIFKPNFKVFKNAKFDYEIIYNHLKTLAFLNKNLKIKFYYELTNTTKEIIYENGIIDFLDQLLINKNKLLAKHFYLNEEVNDIMIECVFNYDIDNDEKILSYCNNINTISGGTHVEGFKTSLTRVISTYGRKHGLIPKNLQIIGDDTREGIICVLVVKCFNPQFEGQTKTRLGNIEVKTSVAKTIYKYLTKFFDENPSHAQTIVKYIVNCAYARIASKKAREKIKSKPTFTNSVLPGKLSDCSSKKISERELFLVEGDSAGGSAKLARNRENQAILPLRGKIINTQKEVIERVLRNEEIKSLRIAIGCDIKNSFNDPEISIAKRRYDKIIIMTDADVDGNHISILLLTFFINCMTKLIKEGKVYLAQPPLYKIKFSNNKEKYFFDDEELITFKKENIDLEIRNIQRYKGLGEMNPDQLWDTTMDPETRRLAKITCDNLEDAYKMFEDLMGAKGIKKRKEFIMMNSSMKINLDI